MTAAFRIRLITTLLMSGVMSLSMSGIMTMMFAPGAPTLSAWALHWLIAWPFAFALSLLWAPLMTGIAARLSARFD